MLSAPLRKKTLKKIRKKIRKASSGLWKSVWPVYETARTSIVWPHEHSQYDPMRGALLKGRKALIVGSGPSAAELERLPDDTIILTCKGALKLFVQKNLGTTIDLYLSCKGAMKRNAFIEELLPLFQIGIFVMDDLDYIRRNPELNGVYKHLIPDDGKDNFYFKRLLPPERLSAFKSQARTATQKTLSHVSSGLRLLQYALYFGAAETYLIGIDLNDEGYFWGQKKKQKHLAIDHYFLELVSKKFENVYSASARSPITQYLPYKCPHPTR